ncbi:MAG: hypothetical protein QF437_10990 [Planctomycetota bacterium]|jgi:hypothetical protein|nr:hypothetical protein [Planctomycetota bacterium]MDP7131007.1 hypothetical protein [Planctomycetota bacterium]MDP7252537.1 hypothetical protein [Planctomycetota bacterium]
MRFWEENKKLIVFAGVSLFTLLLFLYWSLFPWPFGNKTAPNYRRVLAWPWGKPAAITERKVLGLVGALKAYYPDEELDPVWHSPTSEAMYEIGEIVGMPVSRKDPAPNAKPEDGTVPLRDFLKDVNDYETELGNRYDKLQETLSHVTYQPYRTPKWELAEAGFYFMQLKQQVQAELNKIVKELEKTNPHRGTIAYSYDLRLGYNFVNPPTRAKATFLLIQMGIIRDVIELAFRCGIMRVNRILPAQKMDKRGSKGEIFFEEYPTGFAMNGDFPSIKKFLNSLDGVHGKLVIDTTSRLLFVDRGSKHGLRDGERLIITRGKEFVATASVEAIQPEKAQLSLHEFNDGFKKLEPQTGDRVWNHFYVLRTMKMAPITQNPIDAQADMLKVDIKLAAVRFTEGETVKGSGSSSRKKGNKKGKESGYNYKW